MNDNKTNYFISLDDGITFTQFTPNKLKSDKLININIPISKGSLYKQKDAIKMYEKKIIIKFIIKKIIK